MLILNPKRVFTYEMLLDLVWHEDYTYYSRKAINNHISNLRKKIKISITISLLAGLCGIISKTPEGSSGLMFPLFILPFISSGFVPTEAMPSGIKIFAEVQPMTPMIDSVRALILDLPLGNSLWIALIWCLGLSLVSFFAAIQVYTHKSAQ